MPRGEPRSRAPWEESPHCDSGEHGAPGEGEKRGKTRFRNTEERFLEPNSLKKKKKSSVWLATGKHFYIWVSLEALQISVVCSSRVINSFSSRLTPRFPGCHALGRMGRL